jgi:4-amino-4-deoxy-L-arabinose transferase-like glycosyltransferase
MKNILSLKSFPFWLLTLSFILLLVISQLVQDGIFNDGVLYISVSKNLAEGLGTFWDPHFNKVWPVFREQPPLYFGLLAIFFKIFGTGMYTERIFCFTCMLLTAFFINKIWKKVMLRNNPNMVQQGWFPILLWISVPVCFWAYSNHVEETVMALFATIAVYYLYQFCFLKQGNLIYLILGGVFIFLSSLTKGIQGVFPVTAVFFYWLVSRKISFKQNIIYSVVLIGIPALIYGLLILFNHHVYDALKEYLQNRLGKTFQTTVNDTTDYHLEIVVRLFTELIPMFLIMGLIVLLSWKMNTANAAKKELNQTSFWFLLIGLSGTLPLAVTLEQRGFYMVTAFPVFALSVACFLSNRISFLTDKINVTGKSFNIFKIISIIVLVGSLLFTVLQIGKTKRDEEMLPDIYAIGKIVPYGEVISIPSAISYEWGLSEYFSRNFYITLDAGTNQQNYFMIRKDLPKNLVPPNYKLYPIHTTFVDLYVKEK